MTPRDLHGRAKELFAAACARTPGDRPAYLRAACADDEELLHEVESLLAFHDDDGAVSATLPATPPSPRAGSGTSSTRLTGRFQPGELFARRYRVVELLGIGGMGEVYRAHDEVLAVPVALKFISEADDERRERLLHEVRLARRVTHAAVCRVFDVGQVGKEYFISMEYVDGEDLSSLLRRIGRLPGDKLLEAARQLCAGLAAAHARGVLHQDLKPGNVLVDGEGKVRITDFGIATTLDGSARGGVLGTPAYMAPERLAGQAPSVQSDLYALGLVLYEMATGRPVFRAASSYEYAELHRDAVPAAPSSHVHDVDPRLEAVVLACLEKDPRRRPASALEVAAALPGGDPLAMALEAGATPSPELVARVRGEDEGLRPGLAAALLALLAAALAGVFFLAGRAVRLPAGDDLKPPAVLAERAAAVLHALGHYVVGFEDEERGGRPAGRAWGFVEDFASGGEPRVRFWYRQSPFPLLPESSWRRVFDEPRVSLDDPPPTGEGMVQVVLDAEGRLMMLYVLPAVLVDDQPPAVAAGPDWAAALAAAGFDPAEVTPADGPRRVPPVYAEERRAWTGADPRAAEGEERPRVHVDAAAHRGRVVYFSAWPETVDEPPRSLHSLLAETLILDAGLIVIALAAIGVARYNVRRGRGDLYGARRLVIFVVAAKLVYWLLAASHVPSLEDELVSFHVTLGVALVEALLVWLAYVALEPTVRRLWPRTLISWSRVLRGRWVDPLVGRGLLVGALAGGAWTLVRSLDRLAAGWLGLPPAAEIDAVLQLERALNARLPVAHLLAGGLYAVYAGVLGLFLLTVLRLLGRRAWVAVAGFVLVQGAAELLVAGQPRTAWLSLGLVIAGSAAWILLRFGLLAYIAALFVEDVLTGLPVTSDLTAWFAGAGLFALAVTAALALFGTWTALAGRPLAGGWLGPDAVAASRANDRSRKPQSPG